MFFSLVKRLHLDGSYIRSWLILAIDLAVSATATLVAFLGIDYFVRNSGFSLLHYLFLLVSAFFCSAVAFYIFRTYRTVIRHSSLREVWKLGAATLLKELLMLLILWFWPDGMTFKAIGLCVVLDLFVTVCMLITVRVLMILLYDAIILSHIRRTNRIRTLVYGVESKEVALVMRLQNSPHYDMCGFITYGRRLKYYEIAERPVYYFETEENIEYVLDKFGIEAILFGNYANAKAESDRLIKYCVTHGVKVLIAPPIDEIVDGKLAHQGGIRDIKIEDLLGREEIKISLGEIMDNFRDKTVLVTGAAGSIGSELCRQLATFGIRQLILFDNAETPMHEIRLEMEDRFPDLKFVPVIGDVRIPPGMPADSIVLTSYDAASSKIKGYKKLTPTIGVSGANLVLTTTDSVRVDQNTAWTPMSKQIVTMPATMSTAINSIMSSLVNGVVSNLKASAETNYTITIDSIYEAKKDEVIRVMEIDATTKVEATSLKDTKMIVDINFLKGSNKENVMNIKATAPTNDTKITVDFSPAVDPKGDGIKENVNMATLYITSDAMGIITDNETISDEVQEVTVSTTASGLYVKNGKGNYVIVNMVGKVVSTGIITSDEQYISTPNMPNGIYMISIDQSKLLRSAHKTTVKFVK